MSFSLPELPSAAGGYLPYWQLFVSGLAIFNTVSNFATLKFTKRIYDRVPPSAPVTGLQARTFAVWTLMSAVVRVYCAYHIHEKAIYDMALFSYLIAFGHFSSEVLIFRTSGPLSASFSSMTVATTTLIWMLRQYDFYVKA